MLGLDDLFQSEEFLSMEFAPSSLKVARAQPDGSSLSVDFVDREPVDPDDTDRVEKYTRALTTLRDRRSFSGISEVAFSLPTSGVIVRPLELPAVSGDRLDRAVRYEVEDKDSEIPFSPQDVVMDYEVIERTEESTRVVLAVVKRDKMEEYLTVIENVGLETKIIDITSFSLFNFFHYFQGETSGSAPRALVDVGEYHTDIVLFQGSSLHYARSTSMAGRQFTESIQDQLDVEFERAEEIKVERGNLPLTEEPESPAPPAPPSPEEKTTTDESDEAPAPPPPPGETGGGPEAKIDDEADEEALSLGTEFETDEGGSESSTELDSKSAEEPPAPPEPPGSDEENAEDESDEAPPPPRPPGETAEDVDDGTDGETDDESLSLGTEFEGEKKDDAPSAMEESGEAAEGPSPPEESELDLGKSLETETDEADDESESLTLEDEPSVEDRDEPDEEPTLDSGLDLGTEESESEPEPPSPPNETESSSEQPSDEAPAPPPPPEVSGEESSTGDEDTEDSDDLPEPQYGGEESSGDNRPGEASPDETSEQEPAPEGIEEPSRETGDAGGDTTDTPEQETAPENEENDIDLGLGLGERRSPDDDSTSGEELTDPLREEDEDENEGNSLGAAANDPPAPPSDPDFDPEDLQDALEQPAQRLIDELRQTFDYFRDEMNGGDVEEIVLCGNGARIKNLPTYLEEELGRSTRYFQPDGLTGLVDEQSTQTMMSVLGLQLRSEPSRCPVQLNLLPEELVHEREQQQRRQKMVVNGALAGLLVLQVLVWLFYSYQVRLSHYQTAQEQLEQVQPIVDRVNQLEQTQETLQQRLDVINDLETRRARLLPVLQTLNRLESPLRERTWIRNISYSAGDPHGVLKIEGVTGSFQDVSGLYQWLQEREFTVEQTSGSQNRGNLTVDGQQRGVVEFSVGYEVRFNSFNVANRES